MLSEGYQCQATEEQKSLGGNHEVFEQGRNLRELLKALPDLIFILDGEGNYLEVVSERDDVLFAKPGSSEGQGLWDALPKPQADQLVQFVRDTIVGSAEEFIEYEVALRSGKRWFEARAAAIEYGDDGKQAAVFISRDVTDRRRAQQEVKLQSKLTQLLAAGDIFEDAVERALCAVCENSIWEFGEAWVVHPENQVLRWGAAWWPVENRKLNEFIELSRKLEFKLGEGLPGRVWRAKRPEWIADLSIEPDQRFFRGAEAVEVGIHTAVAVPVVADGRVEAVLTFFTSEIHLQTDIILETLLTVATQAGVTLQRIRAEQELQDLLVRMETMALQDDLTGMLNRRAITRAAEDEWDRSKRKNMPISLILLDIDNLKELNDEYGHLAGDEAIKKVASLASGEKRSYDQIGRWGGDEFMILLPDTARQQAEKVMERLLSKINKSHIELGDGRELWLEVSGGVASVEKPGEDDEQTLETLFVQADGSLYDDKSVGRSKSGSLKMGN